MSSNVIAKKITICATKTLDGQLLTSWMFLCLDQYNNKHTDPLSSHHNNTSLFLYSNNITTETSTTTLTYLKNKCNNINNINNKNLNNLNNINNINNKNINNINNSNNSNNINNINNKNINNINNSNNSNNINNNNFTWRMLPEIGRATKLPEWWLLLSLFSKSWSKEIRLWMEDVRAKKNEIRFTLQ